YLLSLRRPSLWQRIWKSYPLLELNINIVDGQSKMEIRLASQTPTKTLKGKLNWSLHLNPTQYASIDYRL
ncbi:MAG: hypothetical protein NTY70_11895, partial [Burkholderiales bacterium]|nr:hypothetical protein [Burkholderiales bacterium]